ncbi:MAG: hypothetical protein HRT38_12390 [Alteromonadaceae bacterium]|nr:hypothetical protein [Alteromonadaceae bacterium]
MNIDDKIKQELESEAKQIDQILVHDPGLFNMLANAYKGKLGGWLILVGIVTFFVSILMFWCGYEFFFVEGSLEHKLQWGVALLLSTMIQISLKMWTFMEMNRQSTLRELKRFELSLNKLTNTVNRS